MGNNELIKGSITLFVLFTLFNFINYLFHFTMARMLTVASYGVLVVLMTIVHYFTIPGNAIHTTFSKYTSKVFNNDGKVKDLLFKGLKRTIQISILSYIIFIPIAIFLSYFLKIDFFLIALIGLLLFSTFVSPVMRGILQGKKRFKKVGASMCFEAAIKLILAIVLVYFIKNVYGAIFAVVLSIIFGFLISLYLLKDIISKKRQHSEDKGIYSYSWKTFVVYLALILVFGMDVILVRRFFSPDLAGKYAVASMIGKMIYFGSMSIGTAMFPISSMKKTRKEKNKVFIKSLFMVSSLCILALLMVLIFPELIITILFGEKYVEVAGLLFLIGIAFSMRSITNLNLLHKLSCGEITNPYLLFIPAFLGIIILIIFHQTILIFVLALCLMDLIMLIGSLFLKTKKLK